MKDFKDFCEVDKGLSKLTVSRHVWRLRKILEFMHKPLGDVTKEDIRAFLKHMKEEYEPSYYANYIKTLRVFFRDYLGRETKEKTGLKIAPKVLCVWFCDEIGRLGVAELT